MMAGAGSRSKRGLGFLARVFAAEKGRRGAGEVLPRLTAALSLGIEMRNAGERLPALG